MQQSIFAIFARSRSSIQIWSSRSGVWTIPVVRIWSVDHTDSEDLCGSE